MEPENKIEKTTQEKIKGNKIHHILAHSYSIYLLVLLLAVLLDFLFPIKIFDTSFMTPVGFILLVLASILIFWAQKTSRDLRKIENISKESFCRGPYCYTRSPTHWGLFLLMMGFGFIANALFVLIFTIISFVVAKLVFLKKQESILATKYGAPYIEYKKSVKF